MHVHPVSGKKRVRKGVRATLCVGSAVLALAAVVSAGLIAAPASPARVRHRPLDPPSGPELQGTLGRLGLTPERLAAAAVTPVQFRRLLSDIRENLGETMPSLRNADVILNTAASNCNRLRRLVESGRASPEELAAYRSAEQSVTAATSQMRDTLDAILSAAVERLPVESRASLAAMRNNERWQLPVQYLVQSRSEAQWVALRNALSAEQIATRTGGTLSAGHRELILGANATSAVAAAAANLSTHLAEIQNAWNQAMGL